MAELPSKEHCEFRCRAPCAHAMGATLIDGAVPDIMADPWRAVLGVPLRKGDGGDDVRPILIGEALMALPGACLKEITRAKVAKIVATYATWYRCQCRP